MDEHLAELEHRVAAAADAWLTDPRDTGVYVRLVRAIEARRRFLNPQLATDDVASDATGAGAPQVADAVGVDVSGAPVGDVDRDEILDDLGAGRRAPARVGQDLGADPADALRRLRGGGGAGGSRGGATDRPRE